MYEIPICVDEMAGHLAAIEDGLSKSATVLTMAVRFSDGAIDQDSSGMVLEAMEMADEQLAKAMGVMANLKAKIGIAAEAGHG